MKLCASLVSVLCIAATSGLYANNIIVGNTTLVNNVPMAGTTKIQFDLSWENSWRGININSWDAAWVFVKYRTPAGVWNHVRLENTGHVPAGGSQIDPGLLTPGTAYNATTNPMVGVFVYRAVDGTGTFTANGTQLNWNYGAAGINFIDIAEVQVFAIEMVYVPQGAFAAGSGGTEVGSFTDGAWNSGATIPRQITSEAAITIGQAPGNLWGTSSSGFSTIGPTGTLPAAFPKGFAAFYSMKYEMSQQGYVDFLNTLTYTQQVTRTANAPTSTAGTGALNATNLSRNGIDIQTPGVASTTPALYACNLNGNGVYGEATDGKDIACNYLIWGDQTAYLDWSGLRPMTELEFEKACRGTLAPVANEYPWGTTGIAASAYTLANSGATNEGIATNYSTTLGNASYSTTGLPISGPVRVGIFAANGGNSGRVTAGASYYGIMELGGNVFERPVTISNVEGRAFTGLHGNGGLAADGNGDATNWPAPATAQGAGNRGSVWNDLLSKMQVSDRSTAISGGSSRLSDYGGRGVRTAP